MHSTIPGPPASTHSPFQDPQCQHIAHYRTANSNTTIKHLLNYLIAINGHSMVQSTPEVQKPVPTPSPSSSTTSEQPSTCSIPLSASPDPDEETTDTQSTSSNESITSTLNDRQLRPCVPINYMKPF